jgi:iron complex outermembrane receptor protein
MKTIRKSYALRLALLAACAVPTAALAQAEDARSTVAVEEVIVTAQKRAENVQDVPISIVALSGEALRDSGADSVLELTRIVPNLQFTVGALASGVHVRIRGFGAQGNNSLDTDVATYIDGVYIARPGAALASFLDVGSVEVLRGPQGTLFGRNAVTGAISLNTVQPSTSEVKGSMAVEGGSYRTAKVQGALNVPLGDTAAIRVAALGTTFGGYFKNLQDGRRYGGVDELIGRTTLRWDATPSFTATLRADYAQRRGDGYSGTNTYSAYATEAQIAAYVSRFGNDRRALGTRPHYTVNYNMNSPYLDDVQYGASLTLNYELGDAGTLRLISGYRNWDSDQSDGDTAATPLNLNRRTTTYYSDSASHELQYISPEEMFGGRLQFVGGLFYFREKYRIEERLSLGIDACSLFVPANLRPACLNLPRENSAVGEFSQVLESLAAYVQADVKIMPTLTLTLGARYTEDKKRGVFIQTVPNPANTISRAPENTALRLSNTRPSYRANLSWQAADDILVFAGYTTGYKSAAISSAQGTTALGAARLINPERAESFEAGVKSTLLNGRLTLNLTAFQTDVKDFQDRSFNGLSFIIRNAGDVRSRGVELESAYRLPHFEMRTGVAILDAYYLENRGAAGFPGCVATSPVTCPRSPQDLTGRRLPFAPRWNINLEPAITDIPLWDGARATFRVSAAYSSYYLTGNDLNPQTKSPDRIIYGARVEVALDNGVRISAFGENLGDRRYATYVIPQVNDGSFGVRDPVTGFTLMRTYIGTPRTFGLRAELDF